MNERDSEIMRGMLLAKGYEVVDSLDGASIVLFNTCSVRQHAEDRVRGMLERLKARREKETGFRIGVLGCMAQQYGEKIFEEYSQVDIVIGPNNIYELPDLLERAFNSEKVLAVNNKKRPGKKEDLQYRPGGFSAFVNIMYGCNNFCSYCIVPYVRGPEISRPKNEILDEVKVLADKGFKEVTLLGQNVNSYGRGLTNKITFPELLEEVNKISGIKRVRFTTSHPKDAEKSLFRVMRDMDKVCEHLHLPLQSGADKILDLMNRKYKYDEYKRKVDLLRSIIPDAGLSTDILVGFPSEKEKDFADTCKALEEIGFNSAFIFKYSARSGTVSSSLVDDVPEPVKKERNNDLLALQKNISYAKNKEMIGSEQEILVEDKSRMSDKELVGRTRSNISCVFAGDENLIGQIIHVQIKDTSPYTLKGERVEGF